VGSAIAVGGGMADRPAGIRPTTTKSGNAYDAGTGEGLRLIKEPAFEAVRNEPQAFVNKSCG